VSIFARAALLIATLIFAAKFYFENKPRTGQGAVQTTRQLRVGSQFQLLLVNITDTLAVQFFIDGRKATNGHAIQCHRRRCSGFRGKRPLYMSRHEKLDADSAVDAVDGDRFLPLQKRHCAMRPVQENVNDSAAAICVNVEPSSLPDAKHWCTILLVEFLHGRRLQNAHYAARAKATHCNALLACLAVESRRMLRLVEEMGI
jgi:hypothetical protein